MSLTSGSRLGPYEISAPIGAGGMGEVFRARDTKLNRDVAIKVLPAAFADDPERLARLDREAQTLASLNHPNIATIHGIENVGAPLVGALDATPDARERAGTLRQASDGSRAPTRGAPTGPTIALVMELVEGEDLSTHIARGPIPITEALPIARQIAEALEAAHEQGIVHRDLKPANIKVRADGTVLNKFFNERDGVFSPDGKWVAYQSEESGRPEVYVRAFPPPGNPDALPEFGNPVLISTSGGVHATWRPDGKELYYLNPRSEMMAAPISVSGSTLSPGAPVMLFRTRTLGGGTQSTPLGRQYDVAPDGRFLINALVDVPPPPITLLQNWNPHVKK